jgi:FkbM family methyltransferase
MHRAAKARWRNERLEIAELLSRVRRGDWVLDIGANKGSYLFWLRWAVGQEGRVSAFEPQPRLAQDLQRVVSALGWRNVEIGNQGISSESGMLTLHVPGRPGEISPGASFESAVKQRDGYHSFSVPVTTLDELTRASGKSPTFIKCDVEGHELSVFRGGQQTLAKHRPVLLFECEGRHLPGGDVGEVIRFLEGLGYQGKFFSRSGLRPVAEFRPEIDQKESGDRFWDQPSYCNNFLFC